MPEPVLGQGRGRRRPSPRGAAISTRPPDSPPAGRSPEGHRPRRRPPVALLAAAGVAVVVAACGSTGGALRSPTGTPSSTSAGGTTIVIENFTFVPSTLTVGPGATVRVTNKDTVAHTLTSTAPGFDTGSVAPGQTTSFTAPTSTGRYPYQCTIHQYMTGTLVVS